MMYLGFHHLLLKDGPMYDPLVKVPLLVKFPATAPRDRRGQVTDALVSLVDVAPTVLATCGVTPRTPLPGLDLTDATAGHRYVFAEDRRHGIAGMARGNRYKLLWSEVDSRESFFDLAQDPYERDNRVADPALREVVRELRDATTRLALFDATAPTYVDTTAPYHRTPQTKATDAPPGQDERSARHAFFAAAMREQRRSDSTDRRNSSDSQ